jgi:hypothetical protein
MLLPLFVGFLLAPFIMMLVTTRSKVSGVGIGLVCEVPYLGVKEGG